MHRGGGYIQTHCQKKINKKIKRADQSLPDVYGTTLNRSTLAVFLSVVLITEMLEIYIQTSNDQNVQLILKSYLPVVYSTPASDYLVCIFNLSFFPIPGLNVIKLKNTICVVAPKKKHPRTLFIPRQEKKTICKNVAVMFLSLTFLSKCKPGNG
jgi:hypothetical protein